MKTRKDTGKPRKDTGKPRKDTGKSRKTQGNRKSLNMAAATGSVSHRKPASAENMVYFFLVQLMLYHRCVSWFSKFLADASLLQAVPTVTINWTPVLTAISDILPWAIATCRSTSRDRQHPCFSLRTPRSSIPSQSNDYPKTQIFSSTTTSTLKLLQVPYQRFQQVASI